jgi:hypothetical protein
MNETLKKIQDGIEQAVTALEDLEQAIDSGDNRRIGARLYELRRVLQAVLNTVNRAAAGF